VTEDQIPDPTMLSTGPSDASWRLILAHGAGAPMDSPFMEAIAEGLAERGIGCDRFEFPYMAARRDDGKKRPPNKAPVLIETYRQTVAAVRRAHPDARIAIGGKSMGGRMATMLAAEEGRNTDISAIVTLGYPFHPPGKPDRLRTEHFADLTLPVLMIQGTRDPFGGADEVPGYTLPPNARLFWAADGDHSLKPRKASGRTEAQALDEASEKIGAFLNLQ